MQVFFYFVVIRNDKSEMNHILNIFIFTFLQKVLNSKIRNWRHFYEFNFKMSRVFMRRVFMRDAEDISNTIENVNKRMREGIFIV